MAERRLSLLRKHMKSKFPEVPHDDSLSKFRQRAPALNQEALQAQYFLNRHEFLEKYRERIGALVETNHYAEIGIEKEELRAQLIQRLARIYDYADINHHKDVDDPIQILTFISAMQEYDQSQSTVFVVHSLLYMDSVSALGTQKHLPFVEKGFALEEIGCCCMTEMGHGSNLASLETTATYDHSTREFILNSPTATSAKWWIGGLARNATNTVVFARLIKGDQDKGIHAFVVRIRDESHLPYPGITIGDCGHKISQNAIDNGYILFSNFRIPYDNLLDRFAQINSQGKYKSLIKSNEKRFGIQISGLIRGRICASGGSEINMRSGLTIALRYSAVRKQFGEKDGPERSILDYQLQKTRLLPHLAKMFALRAGHIAFMERYSHIRGILKVDAEHPEVGEYHAILSSYKGISSWYSVSALQDIRESLGGHGYSTYASIGRLRNNTDVHVTWEGENNVLMQQASKFILKQVQNAFKGRKNNLKSMEFLETDFQKVKAMRIEFESSEELLKPELIISILESRVNYMVGLAVEKLQENAMKSESIMEAWNTSQTFYLMDLAKAFGEMLFAKEMLKFTEGSVPENRKAMLDLFFLYGLKIVHENFNTLVEFALKPSQGKTIRDTILQLMNDLTDVSVQIIDAIAPPDALHGSTLGRYDGQVYKAIVKAVESEEHCYDNAYWTPLLQQIKSNGKKLRENKL